MTDSIPPLLGLHAYEATARRGGFAAAAEELHLSPSAVSQRVRALEAYVGTQLFERLPRSLQLTEMGLAFLPAVRDSLERLSAATTGLFGHAQRTKLTVRTQISYATTWLVPRLDDFHAAFPDITVRLVSAIWADTLPPAEIDLEIRQGNGDWPGFISTKLHDDFAVVICGCANAGQVGWDHSRAGLTARPRVHVLGFDDLWGRVIGSEDTGEHGAGVAPAPEASLTVDTSVAAIEAVATSSRWAIIPERFARQAVRDGRLHLARRELIKMRQGHYLLRRDDGSSLSGEASAFAQWIEDHDAMDPKVVKGNV